MNILITGANGTIGSRIIEQFIQENVKIKAFIQRFENSNFPDHIEAVIGNLDKPETMVPHLNNMDTLFLLLRTDGSEEKNDCQ